jgi:hypothetical protein
VVGINKERAFPVEVPGGFVNCIPGIGRCGSDNRVFAVRFVPYWDYFNAATTCLFNGFKLS